MKLVTRMREYRAKKGLTQKQLLDIVGVRRETIIYLRGGRYNPHSRSPIALPRPWTHRSRTVRLHRDQKD